LHHRLYHHSRSIMQNMHLQIWVQNPTIKLSITKNRSK
jgi:hypothetical protein